MKHGLFLAAFAVVAQTGMAQAKQDGDAMSGSWTGYIGRTAANPAAVTVALKVGSDGSLSGSLTGAQITPGVIKTGTYDKSTGAIKFVVELHERDGTNGGSVQFDGKVAPDPAEKNALTAQGKMVLGGDVGVFKFVKGPAGAASAAAPAAAPGLAEVKRGYTQTYDWIKRAADLVPADKYSYRPVATVRTFAELVAHVADGSRFYCARGAGKNVQWSDAAAKGTMTKAVVVKALTDAMAECDAAYNAGTQFGPLMENVAHASLHYGNMVTYIRMLGLVPPSS